MYTLTVACQKGGTGKTTTALAIGSELSKLGYRVLFVDTDSQANLTKAELETPFTTGLYDVLTDRKIKATMGIVASRHGYILPSDGRMAQGGKSAPLYGSEPEYRIRKVLQTVSDDFDVAVIDTPPTLGEMTIAALTTSDGVVVPCRADRYSLMGLQDFYATFTTVKDQTTNSKLDLLGVVITAFSGRSALAKDIAEALEQQAKQLKSKVYKPYIRNTIATTEWEYTGYTNGSTAQKDYCVVAEQLAKDMKLKTKRR